MLPCVRNYRKIAMLKHGNPANCLKNSNKCNFGFFDNSHKIDIYDQYYHTTTVKYVITEVSIKFTSKNV